MANLKSREFYPDFHVNIRKDGRVNGVEPVTLTDMGLPYDLDYPEQPVGELPKKLYENLVEEFIFLIDELLPRDIQDLFYKATLDPRRAYWKLFEEAARRMQLPYYLNCHCDEAKGCYPNISDGIRGFIYEGRTLADIYLNTCVTRQMILEDIDYDYTCFAFSDDENEGLLFPAEFALFKMSIYNYKRDAVIPGSEIKGNLVLFSKESEPELVMMEVPEEPDYVPLWDEGIDPDEEEEINKLKEKYEKKIAEIKCVEDYCAEHNIPFLKFTKYQAMSFYESGELGQVLRNSINNPAYAKEFLLHIDDEEENLTEPENIEKNTNVHYSVPDGEAIEWYRGQHDVSETLRNGAGNTAIIAEAPGYFEEHVLTELINSQKEEQAIKAVKELVSEAEDLDENLRKSWLDECDNGDIGAFLAHVFLYAVPQPNVVSEIDEEIVAPTLDEEDEKEIRLFESLVVKHAKPEPDEPPLEIAEKEIEYVKQLLLAYADAEHVSYIDRSDLESIPRYSKYKNNFERSRRDFYSAEKVRESAKDILKLNEKDGFDLVKKEVLDGVVDVWEIYASSDGFTRMLQVMSKATDVNITANTKRRLLEWIGNAEKKGICHILVGENKLWWVDNAENL